MDLSDFPEPDHVYWTPDEKPNANSEEYKMGYDDGVSGELMHQELCQNFNYDAGWKAGYDDRKGIPRG